MSVMKGVIMVKKVGDCAVTIAFSKSKSVGLKHELLWHLTQCYAERVESEARNIGKSEIKKLKTLENPLDI